MKVVLSGEGLKAFMKNLSNMLRLGERIEITVLKRKGKNTYLVEIKGNIFEASFSKNIKNKTIVARVKAIKPEVILENDEYDIEIKLASLEKKKAEQPIGKGKNLDGQKFIILSESNKEKVSPQFRRGEIVTAEIVAKKSGGKYVLKVEGSLFEALSTVERVEKGSKIVLLVESVKPDIVLKTVGDRDDVIEFLPADKVFKGSEKFVIGRDDFGELLIKLKQMPEKLGEAFKNGNFKEVFEIAKGGSALVDKFLKPFETLKKALEFVLYRLTSKDGATETKFARELIAGFESVKTGELKSESVALKDLKSVIETVYKETDVTQKNEVLEFGKPNFWKREFEPHIVSKLIYTMIESIDEKDLDKIFGMQGVDKVEADLKSALPLLLPLVIYSGDSVKESAEMMSDRKGLVALFEQIAERVESILKSGKALNDSLIKLSPVAKDGKGDEIKALLDAVKDRSGEFSKILGEIHEKSSPRVDVDAIKNILKHTHGKFAESNLFVQAVVFVDNREETIFVRGEKEGADKRGALNQRKFRLKIASNSEKMGFFQIDGVYVDGKIACSVGFERNKTFENFKSNIDNLKLSLGNSVSLDVYLIKKPPKLVRKHLDIKT